MRDQRRHRFAVVDAGLEAEPGAVRQRVELRDHVEARVLAQPQHVDRGEIGQKIELHVVARPSGRGRRCATARACTWIVVSSRKRTASTIASGNAARSTMRAGWTSISSLNQRSRDQASSSRRASFSPSTSLTGAEATAASGDSPGNGGSFGVCLRVASSETGIRLLEFDLSRVCCPRFGRSRRRVGRERRRAPPWPPAVRRGDFPRRRRSPACGPSSRT